MRQIRVSIDGPTASGKTSLGRSLANYLSIPFLDTGLTYRAVALAVARSGNKPDAASIVKMLERVAHRPLEPGAEKGEERVLLDSVDVTHLIWSESCNGVLPWIAKDAAIRTVLSEYHARLTAGPFIVAGRDVALTIMSDATLRLYLHARFEVRRARRRLQVESGGLGTPVVGATTAEDLQTRRLLSGAPSALVVDTSDLTAHEVFQIVVRGLEQ